jgi:uracil-DNA glycosylase family 4
MIDIKSLQVEDKTSLLKMQSSLKAKPCNLCHYAENLRKEFLFPVASSGTGKILVVGQQAFIEEHKNTTAMSGPFRTIFNNYLSKYTSLTQNDCTFTYAVKCTSTDKNKIVKAKTPEFTACSRFLLQDIRYVDPNIIIFLGKDSSKSLVNTKTRQKTPMGVPFQVRILGKMRWCYYMINPITAKTTTAVVPMVEAHFKGLYEFFKKETNIYDTIPKPILKHTELEKEREYIMIDTYAKLQEMVSVIKQHKYVGMDTETTGLETWKDDFKVVGFSLAVEENKGYYKECNGLN